ncbi:sensor histidine kinase [Hathewaya limosa]|uniref:histidine kinase n=1 Tax=Hathewaya limosa TaxID=1536 RepID=A0ABU0JVY5_HATLI|nr:sensor histidine kinase [Hathewaya limosa]MDQ0480401.1 two-component system LytT family sensor kinase [Hathewaya limosa]
MILLAKELINNLGYIILIVFIITRLDSFKKIMQRQNLRLLDKIILSLIFSGFGILGTYIGTEVNGAIANTRIIGVVTGGILCGPFVGILSGIIAGTHRLLINFGTATALPCAITTVMVGVISSIIYSKETMHKKWICGFGLGITMQTIEVTLIFIMTKPNHIAISIIRDIYIPMSLTNAIGISLLIVLVQSIIKEEDKIAGNEAQIALEIANKTLPYFRDINENSIQHICNIIKESVKADAVAITDDEKILAHVGIGQDHHINGMKIKTNATKHVINTGEILAITNKVEIDCPCENCPLKSAIIVPLRENEQVIGCLKIYYKQEDAITTRTKNLAIGLSQIISTQFEISKLEKLKEMANKAEIKALQAQINPHFLFNALNTIASFVRFNPSRARELIIDLATYLRYNLEVGDTPVDIHKELEQVKAYIQIEKARFGDKLNIIYDIDEGIDIKIPSLIIQPLVENSIKHGILEGDGRGNVKVQIRKNPKEKNIDVVVEDDGIGISEDIIKMIYEGKMKENKIGLINVHHRLLNIYGKGLNIERLTHGTRIQFTI